MMRNYPFQIIEHSMIPLADGTQLSARIWMPEPESKSESRFPAVLEYLPYRKRDGTSPRDDSTYPVFASAGIVGVRVDISGHGESDGVFDDEYSPRELAQGVEVIAWIASQPWSNGSVGMMGISWGGFNGMQIAHMQPPAPALKAVISIGTTVDRYNDDIHYKNGCHLYSNFYWSNMMLTYAARPADPILRNNWQELWKQRLTKQPFPLHLWLTHQRRDDFWKHGSICEDYASYKIPTLIIGGWADLYHNAPPALAANTAADIPVKAINGPWIHKYPHFAWPKPRMDFHSEAINWWNHWLRDEPNDVEKLPAYRAYRSKGVMPGARLHEDGEWIACDDWSGTTEYRTYFPDKNGTLQNKPLADKGTMSICSPLDCGISCGEMFSLAPDADLAGDQRIDDGGSLVFRTPVLEDGVETIGRPVFKCGLSLDKPQGNLCVRLIDVHPDGSSYRVSWGVINLAHRNGNEHPQAMEPGRKELIELSLNECAYQFKIGHRIQISISTNYWPAIHPPPAIVTANISLDDQCTLSLPQHPEAYQTQIEEPLNPDPLPDYKMHSHGISKRWVKRNIQDHSTSYHVQSDTGEEEVPGHGMRTRHTRDEYWRIKLDDPLSMTAQGTHTWWSMRDEWHVKIVCQSTMSCDAEFFYVTAKVSAWLGEKLFHEKQWQEKIERDHI